MLSILALILVILALTGEMAKEGTFKNEKVEAAVHFGKAHALRGSSLRRPPRRCNKP
jgi:hypothetical protein